MVGRRFFCYNMLLSIFFLPSCATRQTKQTSEIESSACLDLVDLSESDLALREALAYVDTSPIETSNCANCNLWLPPTSQRNCGGCTLFKGRVQAQGYCTNWAPQVLQD